jgi:hypothetical protein
MKTKTITVDKDGIICLYSFRDFIDTSKVEFYELKLNKDKTLTLKFYDKNKKLVKPNKEK